MELFGILNLYFFVLQILGGLNSTIEPCEKFWEFSCGGWLEANPLPKSRGYWDVDALEELKGSSLLHRLVFELVLLKF
jgi:hypothetical protein